ncbi:MAG: hypothetical protein PHZ09_12745 [Eubacteriales bacterium]|nr:hypothetical protein [Eubacteriales bacterium]
MFAYLKYLKRAAAAVLAAIILFGALSCAADTAPETGSTGDSTAVTEDEETSPAIEYRDLDGYIFRVLARNNSHHLKDVYAETENGDILNDAVLIRNYTIEDKLNISLDIIPAGDCDTADLVNALRASAKSGSDDYDLALGHTHHIGAYATENELCNWLDISTIDYDNQWWNANVMDAATVGGRLFFIMSDYVLDALDYTYTMVFNQRLFADYNLDNPYDHVEKGTWTIDTLYALIRGTARDLDNDGKYTAEDFYGLVFEQNNVASIVSFMYAAGQFVTEKDSEGMPRLCFNTPKAADITQKVYDIVYTGNQTYLQNPGNSQLAFRSGNTLMAACFVRDLMLLRDMEDSYGILPYPKYDEHQTAYYSHVGGHASLMCIPIAAYNNLDTIGVIMDAISGLTSQNVIPKYYEQALQAKGLRDPESEAMLDMLINGRVFDFAYFYNTNSGLATMLSTMIAAKNNNFASEYAKLEERSIKYFQKVTDSLTAG